MVAPQWGSFQKPDRKQEEQLEDLKLRQKETSLSDEENTEEKKPQWGDFKTPDTYQGEIDSQADEGFFKPLLDYTIIGASRLGEQLAGRYGNIEKFAKDTLVNLPTTGGILGYAISELVGPDNWRKLIQGPGEPQQYLPTSQNIKDLFQGLTGEYTTPKGKAQEAFSEFAEDVGATLIRGRAPTIGNNILIPAAANTSKQILKETGFGEDKANIAKMAVWLPLSLANNVNAPRFASQLMNQGRNGVPDNLQIVVPRLQNRIAQLRRDPQILHADPRSALARAELDAIERDLANGQTSVRSMMNTYDGVNAAKRSRDMFSLTRADQGFATNQINKVRDAIREEIQQSSAAYPQAMQNWNNGINAWATIHRSNAITNQIERWAKGPYAKILTAPAAGLFGIGSFGVYKAPLVSGTGAAVLPAAYKTGQTLYRMWNNPNLANYYWNSINAVNQNNLPAFLNNYNKLNKGLEKKEKSKPVSPKSKANN
jgi:hypothetical protein